MEPSTTLGPGDRLAEFEVVRPLGRGGMGIVYLVRDRRLGRQVALKVIAPHLAHDREFQERFAAEARSAAAIEHPNVVTVYSAGSADGHLFIAMRYIEGTDLRKTLSQAGPLDGRAAARIVADVAGALDAAHAAGFVHRDVKPANILLRGEPGRGSAYLTDFGLTRGMGSSQAELTGTGQWIGTLDYVAPEQVAAGRIDARTDIYSLGSVLYEMLAGRVPFAGDEMQKLWRKANEEPPPLRSHSAPFDAVVARAMAREPARRFRSAGDLGRAASAAGGAATEAPTERSVATGIAAAGLPEVDVRVRRVDPIVVDPPTARMPPVPPPPPVAPRRQAPPPPHRPPRRPPGRGHAIRAAAIVACALAVAAGLVAAALVFASRNSDTRTRTVVTRGAPRERPTTAPTEHTAPTEDVEAAAPSTPVVFEGADYSATLPAGWSQREREQVARDGSYVENTWTSPAGDEELLIDESAGEPADPARSAAKIASDVRRAGETVYSVTNGVEHGGIEGSELDFRAGSGLPERADFFFNLGDYGFAVLSSGYDLATAQSRIDPLLGSLQMNYPATP